MSRKSRTYPVLSAPFILLASIATIWTAYRLYMVGSGYLEIGLMIAVGVCVIASMYLLEASLWGGYRV